MGMSLANSFHQSGPFVFEHSLFLPDLQMASATGPQWNGYWKIPQDEIEIKERIGESVQARNVFRAFWKTRDNLPVAAKNIDFFSDREVRQ